VFHPDFCSPSKLAVSNTVEGFTTAAMHMGEGERWLVYIPHQLGYGSTESTAVPSYSMLTFDMQIVKIYRQ
jgi:FKBP-type peptidyl-prolyl cis-trans isomerase FklB